MKIEYYNTIDDLIAFNRFIFKHNPDAKRGYRFVLFLFPSIIIFFAIIMIIDLPSWAWLAPVLLFLLAVLWFFDFPKRFQKTLDNKVKKAMDSGKIKGVLGKHTIEISEQGIQETTEVNQSFFVWTGIYSIEYNDSCIYVFISPTRAYIIPKSSFSNEEGATNFYSFMSDCHAKANNTTA
jgi:YcxB-like protein